MFLNDGANIQAITKGGGDSGDILITVSEMLKMSGCDNNNNISTISNKTVHQGNAGTLTIKTGSLLLDGAQINSASTALGLAGIVNIEAEDSIILRGYDPVNKQGSGIFTGSKIIDSNRKTNFNNEEVFFGNISIKSKTLEILEGSFIDSSTQGTSAGGNIHIETDKMIKIAGFSNDDSISKINTNTTSSGNAGNIYLESEQIFIQDGCQVITASKWTGKSGQITINAKKSIQLSGYAPNDGQGCLISSGSEGMNNNSGEIVITSPKLLLYDGSQIESVSKKSGNSGDIKIMKSDMVLLAGTDKKYNQGSSIISRIESSESINATAGNIIINSKNLILEDGAFISSKTLGDGQGGDISFTTDYLSLSGKDNNGVSSSISSSAIGESESSGDAGSINISSKILSMTNQGLILSEAKNSGGGKINIISNENVYLSNSKISTSVKNGGKNGGNININANTILLNNSNITANAFQGNGGSVTISANTLIRSANTNINASSKLGIDGKIELKAPNEDFSKDLNTLPPDFLDASAWVKTPCKLRTGESASQFIIKSRDAVPVSPDDYQPSPFRYLLDHNLFAIPNHQIIKNNFIEGSFQQGMISLENEINNNHLTKESFILGKIILATEYQNLGLYQKAISYLDSLYPLVENSESGIIKSIYNNIMGDISLATNKPHAANVFFSKSLTFEQQNKYDVVHAMLLNNMGNYYAIHGIWEQAKDTYQKGINLLNQSSVPSDAIKSLLYVNMLRLSVNTKNYGALNIIDIIENTIIQIKSLPDIYDKAFLFISVAALHDLLCKACHDYQAEINVLMVNMLNETIRISKKINNQKLLSYAYGYLGRIYIKNNQFNNVKRLTQKALFYSNQIECPELSYLWQWQLARLFLETGEKDKAIPYYKTTISTIAPIRSQFFQGKRYMKDLFVRQIKLVYLELVELFLENDKNINQAIQIMEDLKAAELQDFYEDECIILRNKLSEKDGQLPAIPDNIALIYPVSFANHLSIIVKTSQYTKHYKSFIHSDHLTQIAKKIQMRIQKPEHSQRIDFLSIELYKHLITPVEHFLDANNIDTLMIIPDGALRLVPFSALKNEMTQQFLIEKYALVTMPLIGMTSFLNESVKEYKPLIAGLSHVEHKSSIVLPDVSVELKKIQAIIGGKILYDRAFTLNNLRSEFKMRGYNLLHIATHGHFGASKEETYIQVYDKKLTPDQLVEFIQIAKYRENQVDLLTLSACETALGNERAALGMAGVSLQAGAKSVIATLWPVSDRASVFIIESFYQALNRYHNNKQKALRHAQLKMIEHSDFNDPVYWAPYVLIGI